jgi:CIC family chloride channel protein
MNRLKHLDRAARFFHLETWFRLLILCVLVGIVAGLGALVFDKTLKFLDARLLSGWLFDPSRNSSWALMLVPALGGGLAGLIAVWLAPEATGHGTDAVIRAFHHDKGVIRARVPLVKGVCSILTIGSGGSAGKEGPIAQIGAGFGSVLAGLFRLSIRDRRLLMLAGVAGGIGAIFKAPLGGALFAAEVLYRDPDFEHDAVIPGVISSVTAYSVFTSIEGHHRILQFKDAQGVDVPPLIFPSVGGNTFAELLHYAVLSLLCALTAFLFVKGLEVIEEKFFKKLPMPRIGKPALGGAMLGLFALLLMLAAASVPAPDNQVLGASKPDHIMSGGLGYLQAVINSALDPSHVEPWISFKLAGFLAVVVLAKIIATSLTIGSGGSGGLLFPALFLGGITGAAYSKFLRFLTDLGWLPGALQMTPHARAGMILVGMGGVFAACVKTPIASLVMVSEITGSYGLVVPLMMTCASAYLLSHSFTMNKAQVPGIAESPAHRGDFLMNVLEEIKVSEAVADKPAPEVFSAHTPFKTILERVKGSTATVFPVVDDSNCLVGIFSLSDIRRIMSQPELGTLVVAGDLGTSDIVAITMDSNLDQALRKFTRKNIDELPVVASPQDNHSGHKVSAITRRPRGPVGTLRLVGMLSRRDLISAYHRRLDALRQADDRESRGSNVFVEALAATPGGGNESGSRFGPAANASNPEPELLNEPPDDSETARPPHV